MKKLKESQKIWIRGIPGKKYKILSILKNLGGISYDWYEGEDKDFIFYITPNGYIDCVVDNSKTGAIVKDNYKEYIIPENTFLRKEQKIWIKSSSTRGKEVIDKLLSLGATNPYNFNANAKDCTLFIAPDGTIEWTEEGSSIDILIKDNYKEYKLPNILNKKP